MNTCSSQPSRCLSAFALLLVVAASTVNATAQCSNQWHPLGAGTNGTVNAVTTLPNGDLVAGGRFTAAGGVSANNIAKWDGANWSALGSGLTGTGGPTVHALTTLPNGDLVAGGVFNNAGGVLAYGIALWDGTSWAPLGGGISAWVFALTTLSNGDLVAGGQFTHAGGMLANNIARWDGMSWSPLGAGTNAEVYALTTLPNGDLVAGGEFTTAGGVSANYVALWDGVGWSSLGAGMNSLVSALLALTNGELIAGGQFTTAGGTNANYVARWNGGSWSPIGAGATPSGVTELAALTELPNGDILAAVFHFLSMFPPVWTSYDLLRWDGASWSTLATGTNSSVWDLVLSNDEVVVGGALATIGPLTVNNIARLTTTCPATVTTNGSGCTGSAGPNVLTANNLPWTGSTFQATATGLTNNALGLSIFGLTPQQPAPVPLSSLVAQGVTGCSLDVSTESVQLLVPTAGSADTHLVIPNTMAFAGVVLHHQVVAAELNFLNAIAAVTSTNALTLTIGTL